MVHISTIVSSDNMVLSVHSTTGDRHVSVGGTSETGQPEMLYVVVSQTTLGMSCLASKSPFFPPPPPPWRRKIVMADSVGSGKSPPGKDGTAIVLIEPTSGLDKDRESE